MLLTISLRITIIVVHNNDDIILRWRPFLLQNGWFMLFKVSRGGGRSDIRSFGFTGADLLGPASGYEVVSDFFVLVSTSGV